MEFCASRHAKSQGFSIVELVVVISIIAVLLSVSTIAFNSWQTKHAMESQIRAMAADFSGIRMRAITTKQRHTITLNAKSYVFGFYSSEENASTPLPGGFHSVVYKLQKSDGSDYSNDVYEIDQRGTNVSITATIYLENAESSSGLNCLKLHTVRINPGNRASSGGTCDNR